MIRCCLLGLCMVTAGLWTGAVQADSAIVGDWEGQIDVEAIGSVEMTGEISLLEGRDYALSLQAAGYSFELEGMRYSAMAAFQGVAELDGATHTVTAQILDGVMTGALAGPIYQGSFALDPLDPEVFEDELENDVFDPVGILLTWRQDPTSTMVIDWHTLPEEERPTVVEYREKGADAFAEAAGDTVEWPDSDRTIHRVELTGLDPATKYEFNFGPGSESYYFRTMPETAEEPIRFAIGGDMWYGWSVALDDINRQAARYDAEFIVIGGDLAYADAWPETLYRWYELFEVNKETLVTSTGRVIPMVAGIGNHEVRGGYYDRDDHERREGLPDYEQTDEIREILAPYYFALFAFPGQPGYNVLDFGDYLSIVLLDTQHVNPVEGEQTEWLESVLAERTHVPHVFPVYHVPAYPSARSFDGHRHQAIRDNWTPLFDEYGVRVAFENHDHTYKRTYPIRGDEVHPNGVVYLGDGAWGVPTRDVHPVDETWYLKKAESANHFILATIHGPYHHFVMIDDEGVVIDEYPERAPMPALD